MSKATVVQSLFFN